MITDVFSVCKDNIVFQMNEFCYSLFVAYLLVFRDRVSSSGYSATHYREDYAGLRDLPLCLLNDGIKVLCNS